MSAARSSPRPAGRLPRRRARRQCVSQQRLLPGLDRRPPRPLRDAASGTPRPRRGLGRPRLRARLRARARSPIAGAGWSRRSPRSRASCTRSPPRVLLPAAAAPGSATRRRHRAGRLHAADHLPQHRHGLDGVPSEARDAGRGMGLTDASCCGASSCRSRCRRSWPGCGSPATTTVALAALAIYAGAGGLGDQMASQNGSSRTSWSAAALCVLMAVGARRASCSAPQRAAHPLDAGGDGMTLAFLDARRRDRLHLHTSASGRGGAQVGGSQLLPLLREHLLVTGRLAGHRHRDRAADRRCGWATAGAGRSSSSTRRQHRPRGPVIARRLPVLRASLGAGFFNITLALVLLAIPPICSTPTSACARSIPSRSTPPAGWA